MVLVTDDAGTPGSAGDDSAGSGTSGGSSSGSTGSGGAGGSVATGAGGGAAAGGAGGSGHAGVDGRGGTAGSGPVEAGVDAQADTSICVETIVEAKLLNADAFGLCDYEIPPFPSGVPHDFALITLEVQLRTGGVFTPVERVNRCSGTNAWLLVTESWLTLCPGLCDAARGTQGRSLRFVFRCGGGMPRP
jgi:hypothetical protein